MKRFPLRLKLLLTTSFLVIGVVGGVLGILGSIVSRQITVTAATASEQSNAALEQAISSSQQELLNVTRLLADRPGTSNIYQADYATISDHLDEQNQLLGTDWMVMTDPDGVILGQSATSPFMDQTTLASLAAVKVASGTKPWRGIINRPDVVAIAAAQPIQVGEYVHAILLSGRQINRFFLQPIARATNSEILIFRNQGFVASSVPIDHPELRTTGIQRVIQGDRVLVGSPGLLPGTTMAQPLQFAALVPESRILEPFQPLWRGLSLLLVAGLVVAIIAGASLAHSVAEPISGLVQAAQVLRSGRWPERLHSTRQDELGILQEAFDEMSDSLRSNRQRLESMLEIDPLTELPNYRTFRTRVDNALEGWATGAEPIGLLLLDIDNFESYNQTHGADAGDQVLISVARIVSSEIGTHEVAARYAGNEFALLVNGNDSKERAEALRSRIESETVVTVSIGVCQVQPETARTELFLLAAESTASQAKSAGRNRVREFEGFQFTSEDADLRQFLQHGSYGAVRALAEAVDAKDEYTRGHSQRVAEYARDLASFCGHDPGFVELVFVTGTLHDVGKIGVPDSVLKKESKLTDEEFGFIKLHPELGEKIVRQIPQLKDTLPGIRSHHERYDGRGYPDQLVGESISLMARILAVADTYDAMTSDRPYRKGLPVDYALQEIEKGAGSQFDPHLANSFVQMMRQAEEFPQAA